MLNLVVRRETARLLKVKIRVSSWSLTKFTKMHGQRNIEIIEGVFVSGGTTALKFNLATKGGQ
jgi:hypothetical protein